MPGPDDSGDEFSDIARLYRPLTRGAPEALALLDDAAVLPARTGQDLVLTTDALVEGVHFLVDDPLDTVARKLLRVNLSDLAAKGAEPYGYLLTTAWSARCGSAERAAFAAGLDADGTQFALTLLGGDTVATPGPLTVSATMLGYAPAGAMVRRGGAEAGDVLLVSGWIGKGLLGLAARRGERADPDDVLTGWYRLPEPRLALATVLRTHASAAADVSDGLIADAGHIAEASGLGLTLELDCVPTPPQIGEGMRERLAAASAGDDYEIVCAAAPDAVGPLTAAAAAVGVTMTAVVRFEADGRRRVTWRGESVDAGPGGWRHI